MQRRVHEFLILIYLFRLNFIFFVIVYVTKNCIVQVSNSDIHKTDET